MTALVSCWSSRQRQHSLLFLIVTLVFVFVPNALYVQRNPLNLVQQQSTSSSTSNWTSSSSSTASSSSSPSSPSSSLDTSSSSPLHPLNFCQRLDLTPTTTTSTTTPTSSATDFSIWYTCQGPSYDAFTSYLHAFADNVTAFGTSWGRRTLPLPPHAHVLFWGNSHVRQIAHALVCQQVQAMATANDNKDNVNGDQVVLTRLDDNGIQTFEFKEINASITTVTNHAMQYRKETWQLELTRALGNKPLSEFTAVLLGHLETCEGNGSLAVRMRNETNNACLTYQVSLQEWHQAYTTGSIAVVTAFSLNRLAQARHFWRQLLLLNQQRAGLQQQQHPIAFIYGRQYITQTQQECAAKSKLKQNQDCADDAVGQRCVGNKGSHVDLVAWDVTEFLYYHQSIQPLQQERPQSLLQTTATTKSWHIPTLPPADEEPSSTTSADSDKARIAVSKQLVWCNATEITVPHDFLSDKMQVGYQCAGPLYDAFSASMNEYATRRSNSDKSPWGRRSFPAPANTRILVWGNSHLRQVLEAILCQQMQRGHILEMNRLTAYQGWQYTLTNNVTIVSVINSWTPYSTKWARLLERELEMPLHSFHAIVTGFFNTCNEDSTFAGTMQKISETSKDVDCVHTPPPTPWQIHERFGRRPLLYVSMLDTSRKAEFVALQKQAAVSLPNHNTTSSSLSLLDAQEHHSVQGSNACWSAKRYQQDDCATEQYDAVTGAIVMRHACFGRQGSQADMVAWDVMEFLHQRLLLG